jgi:outer membrane scaffolding protein for murein synthesis (MipA/OmpV family)
VFRPHGGLLDLHAGIGLRQPLGPHWVVFGGVGYSHLQDAAAASPLTHRRGSVSANLALAWRSK